MDAEYHQLMLERQQMLEESLQRAYVGKANKEDWKRIAFECGVPHTSFIGESHVVRKQTSHQYV